jgi:SWI/SNF-related matrix-associated actin-dependent regulator of chromatin subfamily A-like protein 1
MKLTHNGTRFELHLKDEDDYRAVKELATSAGFLWGSLSKMFFTTSTIVAQSFQHYADEIATQEIYRRRALETHMVHASSALTSSLRIPCPIGKKPFPFQPAMVAYYLAMKQIDGNRRGMVCADEMGTGKTIEGALFINYFMAVEPIHSVLVICPASLKLNWQSELGNFLVEEHGIQIADANYWPRYSQIVIVNYDILGRHEDEIRNRPWDIMLVDESHKICNPAADRTRQVFGGPGIDPIKARHSVFFTGTPIRNGKPIELYPVLQYCDPLKFASKQQYGIMYCDGKKSKSGKWNFSGVSNEERLQEELRSSVMIRRLKKDVMPQLPPKIRQLIELPPGADDIEIIQEEIDAWNSCQNTMADAKAAIKAAKDLNDDDAMQAAMKLLRYTQSIAFNKMSKFRRQTAVATIPYVVDHLTDCLADNDKVIVFVHHHEMAEAIARKFDGQYCIVYGGRLQTGSAFEEQQKFQNDPKYKLFICSLQMAVGLTLTAAALEVFAELDWVPANMLQAEDRAHRFGQLSSLLIQILVLKGSVAARMCHKLVEKMAVHHDVLDSNVDRLSSNDFDIALELGKLPSAKTGVIEAEATEPAPEPVAAV